ncbi:MAG: glucosidase [Chloroflexota bacterium]|nr:MAG: glucosidase [Chloroflexota bacterium]
MADKITAQRNGDAEKARLAEADAGRAAWRFWGPYVSERAWGTVREDYSARGDAWNYLSHDHARSRAYRWSEDGLAGICDEHQRICFALALWNHRDPILKERAFGLTNAEGNHGEDVKEYYYYLDSTPTHSYMKYLYKYPHAEYPYAQLLAENRRRGKTEPEYELLDTGVFNESRYFDIFVEYAKATPDDLLIEITACNRGADAARLDVLPTIWFRNLWAWDNAAAKGDIFLVHARAPYIELRHPERGTRYLYFDATPNVLFTENATNTERLYGAPNASPYVKDAFHDYIVRGKLAAVNPAQHGTKAAPRYALKINGGASARIRLRFTNNARADALDKDFDATLAARKQEADDFYATVIPATLTADEKRVMRQALAGMLWSKQYYHYNVRRWLQGDPTQPPPPATRWDGRNSAWQHLYTADVISMPDKWEFCWFASWDLAFHCVALALVDLNFAKNQLLLMLREWYMNPNGQIPAYEWDFNDVNPPVHAWAAQRIFEHEFLVTGKGDHEWLEMVFQKLLLNFTWWVNRQDAEANNLFQGGFLGLDNIGLFDRNMKLPTGFVLEQSDGTSWMATFCFRMLTIALNLAREDAVYQAMATKFVEHALLIADAMNNRTEARLWDETDGFFYDHLRRPDGQHIPIRTRTMVGLIPLIAVVTAPIQTLRRFPEFLAHLDWFREHRPDLADKIAVLALAKEQAARRHMLIAVMQPEQLRRLLEYMLAENEFLAPFGLRSVSKIYTQPLSVDLAGYQWELDYEPGESTTNLFGGNSNWRGPIWLSLNYLIIESLQVYHRHFGDTFQVECPTGSGHLLNLGAVAQELSERLARIFTRDENGRRAVFGACEIMQNDPHWRDYILFHEYFHGDDGSGRGASHQTGWSGLIAKILEQLGDARAGGVGANKLMYEIFGLAQETLEGAKHYG